MKKIVIIGGTSGLGLSLAIKLRKKFNDSNILIIGRNKPEELCYKHNFNFYEIDLSSPNNNWKFCQNSNYIIYAAGIGKISKFDEFEDEDINKTISINATNVIQLINSKKKELMSLDDCKISVVTSIASKIPSPLFAIYGATKALVSSYISSINIELLKNGSKNQIIEIAPGYIEGTSFYGKKTDIKKINNISEKILDNIDKNKNFIIPENDKMYLEIIKKAQKNPQEFGSESYDYKILKQKERK